MANDDSATKTITAVICHYNPNRVHYLQHLVCLCAGSLRRATDDHLDVLVCDGGPTPDPYLENELPLLNCNYLHGGQELSFPQTYNLGVEAAQSDYVVLIANDIFVQSHQIRQLVDELSDDVGCAISYLSNSSYPPQGARPIKVPYRSFPSSMTINLNAFERKLLLEIGGVPEELSGFFNDVVIFQRLRALGKHIVMVDVGDVVHLDRTTRSFSSNVAWNKDFKQARQMVPEAFRHVKATGDGLDRGATDENIAPKIFANCAQSQLMRYVWRIAAFFKWHRVRYRVNALATWIEPYLAQDRFVTRNRSPKS